MSSPIVAPSAPLKYPPPAPSRIEVVADPLSGQTWSLAAVLALAFVALLIFLGQSGLRNLRGDAWFSWVIDDRDDTAHAAAQALSGRVQTADVVLLGNSGTREAFWTDDRLRTAWINDSAATLGFMNLGTSGQSPLEASHLVDLMRPRPGQIIVFFPSFRGVTADLDPHAFLRSDFLLPTGDWLRVQNKLGVVGDDLVSPSAMLDLHWHAYRNALKRGARYPLAKWMQREVYAVPARPRYPYRFSGEVPDNPARFSHYNNDFMRDLALAQVSHNLDAMARVILSMAQRIQAKGALLVLATPPERQGEYARLANSHWTQYRSRLKEVARHAGVQQVDLNTRIGWEPTDFVDPVHVSPVGRDKWSNAFLNWLRQYRTQ